MNRVFIITTLCSLMLFSFVLPTHFVTAQDKPGENKYQLVVKCKNDKCGYKDFLNQVNRIVTLLLYLATLLAVISFIYAGFKLLLSGGNEEALSHAKHTFTNVLLGLIFAYGAFIIVNFILKALGVKDGFDLLR